MYIRIVVTNSKANFLHLLVMTIVVIMMHMMVMIMIMIMIREREGFCAGRNLLTFYEYTFVYQMH